MINLNLVGNLGRDAELRYTPSGTAVCNLAVACSYGMKDKDTGYKPTQWVDATLWGKQAEALAQYMTKGTKLALLLTDAHIETFAKNDGTQSSKLVGRVADIEFAGGSQQQAQQSQQANVYGQAPAPQQQGATPPPGYRPPHNQQQGQQNQPAPQVQHSNQFDGPEDDIPF